LGLGNLWRESSWNKNHKNGYDKIIIIYGKYYSAPRK
jgi:hypothetical protein